MALRVRQHDPERDGTLEVEEVHPNFITVYFAPPERSLLEAGLDPSQACHRAKLLEINGQEKILTIYPISTFGDRSDFLKPKYGQINRITLEDTDIVSGVGWDANTTSDDLLDVLESLPSAFTKDFAYGLGLAKPYRFIIDAVEQLSSCTEMVITGKHRTGPAHDDEDIFYISRADFEQLRTELNKIDRHAQTAVRAVKLTAAHNIFAERLGIPKLDPKTGLHPYRKLFTAVAEGKEELSEEDQNTELLY